MTAEALLDVLRAARIRLTVNGDRLHVEAPAASYTSDLRARLIERKSTVLELITMRDRLLGLARTVGVPAAVVEALPASELRACIDQLPLWANQHDDRGGPLQTGVLMFYLRALAGTEPTLPGSLAAHDQAARQVRAPVGPTDAQRTERTP